MKKMIVKGTSGVSQILVGEKLTALADYIETDNAVIITDDNVQSAWGHDFPNWPVITVGIGESVKTLETIHDIYERLISMDADRTIFIVGIGGGIVCDIAGFVASTYLRGVSFGFVASTLLAQVDASVGGKNGVNFAGYKNMVGTFNQPQFVICDLNLLSTMPLKMLSCGFAEMVKHAAIYDADQFKYLEAHATHLQARDKVLLEEMVYESVMIKARVVNQDEKELGERRKLNFGHTLGHAFEKRLAIPHGEAVSLGMVAAARLSEIRGMIGTDSVNRIRSLLKKLSLPTSLSSGVDIGGILEDIKKDKKRESDYIKFVLLESIGNSVVKNIDLEELAKIVPEMVTK